jgi:6-methylsalicylate decarboxylase
MSFEGTSRRNFLGGLAALGAGACFSDRDLGAQTRLPNTRRIDCHHHYTSPKGLAREETFKFNGYQMWRGYTPAKAIEALDAAGAAAAVLSSPRESNAAGDSVPGDIRDVNDYGAKVVSDYKGRFGLFGALPVPDIDASLREVEYVFDTLKADGVVLRTSYGNKWLGDPSFQPLFDELNRRKAIVYTHPVDPCGSLLGLVGRILGNAANGENIDRTPAPNSRLYHLRRFYYDTAGSANPVEMQALKSLVGVSQIIFGSDFPFGNPPIVSIARGLQTCGFSEAELRSIDRENALKILPRFKA